MKLYILIFYQVLIYAGLSVALLLLVQECWGQQPSTNISLTSIPKQTGPLNQAPRSIEIAIGREIFFDTSMSIDGTVSCASCHRPDKGWSDGLPLAVGIASATQPFGQVGRRHTPTIINSSYTQFMFWDGRAVGETTQSILPLVNLQEMGNPNELTWLTRMRLNPRYVRLFTDAFGIDPISLSPITAERVARSLAAFESTVVSFNAPVDRRLSGDLSALTPDEELGFQIFRKANCMSCHVPPLFTTGLFANNGMEFAGKYRSNDLGREEFTRQQVDRRKFKIPTLREVELTAPYNHAGNFNDLHRVVVHYNSGGSRYDNQRDSFLDPRITKLNLSPSQEKYLEIFLRRPFRGSVVTP
jgi:cytochrome c peroxidase